MSRTIKLRTHHFRVLSLIWYPEMAWGSGLLENIDYSVIRYGYTRKHFEFLRKLSKDIRKDDELLIEPTSTLDTICKNCKQTTQKYRPECDESDEYVQIGEQLFKAENKPFSDLHLKYGVRYPAKEIVGKIDGWVKEHPYFFRDNW